MRIGFFVPAVYEGSGGQKTILRHAAHLAARGHDVVLHVDTDDLAESRRAAATMIETGDIAFVRGWPASARLDVGVATAWFTAEAVARCTGVERRIYFVQDHEPSFHESGPEREQAEASYHLGLEVVTIGQWLRSVLASTCGVPAAATPFGVDRSRYRADGPAPRTAAHTVCALWQPEKTRRCADLLLGSLEELGRARPDLDLYLFGSAEPPPLPIPHHHVGMLTDDELADLYRMAGVGVAFSATNPSRIPFEMAACGLPVVERFGPSTLVDFAGAGVTLAHPDAASVAAAVQLLLGDPMRRAEGRRAATGAGPVSLDAETAAFERFVTDPEWFRTTAALPPATAHGQRVVVHRTVWDGDGGASVRTACAAAGTGLDRLELVVAGPGAGEGTVDGR